MKRSFGVFDFYLSENQFEIAEKRRKKLICILENILCQCKPDLVSKEFLIRLELSSTGNAMERHQWLVGPPPGLLSQKTNTNTQKTNTNTQRTRKQPKDSHQWFVGPPPGVKRRKGNLHSYNFTFLQN